MYVPMWLLVFLILFAAAGVWALIFAMRFMGMLIKIALSTPPQQRTFTKVDKPNDPTL